VKLLAEKTLLMTFQLLFAVCLSVLYHGALVRWVASVHSCMVTLYVCLLLNIEKLSCHWGKLTIPLMSEG